MELTADRSACLWILVLSRCQWLYQAANWRFRLFFFFFLLWTIGGGVVDGGCGYGCEEEDWRFGFFVFCGPVVVVTVVVVVSDGGIYYFIVIIILFYCDIYIILLC